MCHRRASGGEELRATGCTDATPEASEVSVETVAIPSGLTRGFIALWWTWWAMTRAFGHALDERAP